MKKKVPPYPPYFLILAVKEARIHATQEYLARHPKGIGIISIETTNVVCTGTNALRTTLRDAHLPHQPVNRIKGGKTGQGITVLHNF